MPQHKSLSWCTALILVQPCATRYGSWCSTESGGEHVRLMVPSAVRMQYALRLVAAFPQTHHPASVPVVLKSPRGMQVKATAGAVHLPVGMPDCVECCRVVDGQLRVLHDPCHGLDSDLGVQAVGTLTCKVDTQSQCVTARLWVLQVLDKTAIWGYRPLALSPARSTNNHVSLLWGWGCCRYWIGMGCGRAGIMDRHVVSTHTHERTWPMLLVLSLGGETWAWCGAVRQ